MWPTAAFSVARGNIQEKTLNLTWTCRRWWRSQQANIFVISNNLLKSVGGCICLIDLLALDKVHLHKNNYIKTFTVYNYCFCFIYLFCDRIRRYGPPLNAAFSKCPPIQINFPPPVLRHAGNTVCRNTGQKLISNVAVKNYKKAMKPDSELLLLHHSNCSSPPYLLCWQRCKPVRSGNPLSTRCSSEMQKFRLVVVHRWDEAESETRHRLLHRIANFHGALFYAQPNSTTHLHHVLMPRLTQFARKTWIRTQNYDSLHCVTEKMPTPVNQPWNKRQTAWDPSLGLWSRTTRREFEWWDGSSIALMKNCVHTQHMQKVSCCE